MKKVILSIEGMSCSACQNSLEKYLNKQKGIKASVNLVLALATIEYENFVNIEDINRYIKEAGFKSLGIYKPQNKKKNNNKTLIVFTILTIIIMYISMMHIFKTNYILVFSSTLYLIYGFDIIKSGIKNMIHRSPNMDTLVTTGILASFIYSLINTFILFDYHNVYYESVCTIIYFVKLGRYIDIKNKEKTKEAIEGLVTITPNYAYLKNGQKITIDEIKVNDILLCKPGMKFAVDGIITKGVTHVSESFITGEVIPKKIKENDFLLAGSLNIEGLVEYKALKIGKDSTVSEIVRLVVEATNTKAKVTKITDKVSSIFTPCIIVISILTFIFNLIITNNISISLIRFVTVLVVSCPCALGLATPLAIVVSEGMCAKKGILVKTSEVLENAYKIDTIVFDKTGTLTYGNLSINKVYNYSNYNNEELIKIISSLESKSNHPISSAFKSNYKYEVSDFKNIDGIGLKGTINNNIYYIGNSKLLNKLNINSLKEEEKLQKLGNTTLYFIENNKIIALIGLKDTIKKSAKEAVKKLKEMNKNIIMLTGDNEKSANTVAKELKINTVFASVLPKEKHNIVKKLMKEHKVMMVGDGINDAISLTLANISVSFNNSTDIAFNSSKVILMNDNLLNIIDLINISKKTIKIIKQNLFFAFFYNICMIPIAMGLIPNLNINPMFASICMMISSLTVVFNALRLRRL